MYERTWRFVGWALGLLAVALWVTPASAAPVSVFFRGDGGFGLTPADAQDANLSFGVPILTPAFIGAFEPTLSVLQILDESSVTPFPPVSTVQNTGTSSWTVTNESAFDLLGSTYVYFVTANPFTEGGVTTSYADSNVGLTIDVEDGWVIIQDFDTELERTVFYPAIRLETQGSFEPAETASPFPVNYVVVNEPLQLNFEGDYELPQLELGMAFAPIPEPAAALLLGFGLAALGALRRPGS